MIGGCGLLSLPLPLSDGFEGELFPPELLPESPPGLTPPVFVSFSSSSPGVFVFGFGDGDGDGDGDDGGVVVGGGFQLPSSPPVPPINDHPAYTVMSPVIGVEAVNAVPPPFLDVFQPWNEWFDLAGLPGID